MRHKSDIHQPFNAFHLKCIAMIAMTADHVAWRFLAVDTYLSEWLHFLGRAVAPLMCYFLVVGYYHTKSVHNYAKRLLVFALFSQPAFWWYSLGIEGSLSMLQNLLHGTVIVDDIQKLVYGNVLFSLYLSLTALRIWHDATCHFLVKIPCILLLYPVIELCDYGFSMIFMTLLFDYFYRKNQPMYLITCYLLSLPVIYVLIYGFQKTVGLGFMHAGMILTALLIMTFNGQKGSNFGGRHLFYWFYPIHLIIIAVAEFLLINQISFLI